MESYLALTICSIFQTVCVNFYMTRVLQDALIVNDAV